MRYQTPAVYTQTPAPSRVRARSFCVLLSPPLWLNVAHWTFLLTCLFVFVPFYFSVVRLVEGVSVSLRSQRFRLAQFAALLSKEETIDEKKKESTQKEERGKTETLQEC